MQTTDYSKALQYLYAKTFAEPGMQALSAPLREAGIFARTLQELPIGKFPGEELAGDYGLVFAGEEFKQAVTQMPELLQRHECKEPLDELDRYCCRAAFSPAHSSAGYETVLQKGLNGLIAELRTSAAGEPAYLEAEILSLEAVIAWSRRYAVLGFSACERVPAEPPRDFAEAVQALWLVHTAIGIGERNDASLSLGRLDQYLYPYFRADLDRGITEEALEKVLIELFVKLNRYGDAACAVNLGGVAPDGTDMFNDLTRMIVKVATRLQLPSPILAARIHPGIRQDDFDALTVPELFRIGQPSFYGEFACRNALLRRGVPADEVHRWAANSCMGLIMPGEEFSDMWALVFTFMLPLELALNHGRPFHGELPVALKTTSQAGYNNAGEIMASTIEYARELLELLIDRHRRINAREGLENPDPYLSALLHGGIPGRDRLLGGPRYHTANVDAFALVNAADALTAIERVVFRDGLHPLDEVVDAVKNNFVGNEVLRRELLCAPKYGNGDAEADRMVSTLAAAFADIVRQYGSPEIVYMPSFHTLNAHVGAGSGWGASADGRLAGEPFAKNIGPMQGRNLNGITGILHSASAIDQQFFYGGQALDLHLDPGIWDKPSDRAKLQAALQTYFEMGGLLIQVNGLDVETMKKAVAHPDMYADLTVRIGGYSARFVSLSPNIQQEMIKRFEHST